MSVATHRPGELGWVMANDDHGCALGDLSLSDRTPEAGAAPQ